MKIVFEGSELKEGLIKVSLDGGFTFADYEIADVKESGIPLDDSQRYDKIKVKGPANILKSLDIVSNVKVEGGQSSDSSDYDTRIEWYSWKSDDGEIIFTKTDDKTQDCIIYEKRPVDEEGHYDYVEFPSASRIAFSWTDDGIVKSWAGGPGIQTYFYSRYPEGDVVVQEPKKTSFYSWRILKGRITESDGSIINEGSYSGTLYTTKNPEKENGPFIFYSIGDNDEVSIEFIQKSVGREFPFTEFKGQYCIYNSYGCIMFYGGVGKQLNFEMASVPVEAIGKEKPFLYIQYDEGYVGYQNRGKPFACVIFNREGINKAFGYEVSRVIFKVLSKDVTDKFSYDESLLVSDKITVISTRVSEAPMNQDWDVGDFEAVLYDDHKVVRYPLRVGNVFEEHNEELELLN